jgi:hypothetical protein
MLIGGIWMIVAVLLFWKALTTTIFSGLGIDFPRWMPAPVALGLVSAMILIALLGWLVPVIWGARILLSSR